MPIDIRTDRIPDAEKPVVHGPVDGNAFAVVGAATKALKRAGKRAEATQLASEYMQCGNYDELLGLVMCYVSFDI